MSGETTRGKIDNAKALWIMVALVSHLAWGAYPVLARYLQQRHSLSPMSLSSIANILALTFLYLIFHSQIKLNTIKALDLIPYIVILISRNTLNLYAARFTVATNVQLFSLMSPFLVAIFSTTIYKEKLPRKTFSALTLSVIGSILIILGDIPRQNTILQPQTKWNLLGIGLSILGGILLAFLMMEIRRIGKKGASAETLAFFQFGPLTVFMSVGSTVIKEDWTPWFRLSLPGVLAFFAFVFIVLLLGTILQNNAIRRLGAPAYSTIQAFRLVATIGFSFFILDEGIKNLTQGIGVVIVMIAITWYMVSQTKSHA
jgi:drug/metabolite transporter (DMT)-like permease